MYGGGCLCVCVHVCASVCEWVHIARGPNKVSHTHTVYSTLLVNSIQCMPCHMIITQ